MYEVVDKTVAWTGADVNDTDCTVYRVWLKSTSSYRCNTVITSDVCAFRNVYREIYLFQNNEYHISVCWEHH